MRAEAVAKHVDTRYTAVLIASPAQLWGTVPPDTISWRRQWLIANHVVTNALQQPVKMDHTDSAIPPTT